MPLRPAWVAMLLLRNEVVALQQNEHEKRDGSGDEADALEHADAFAIDEHIRRDHLLVSDVVSKRDLHLADEASVREILDRLQGFAAMVHLGTMTKAAFADREQANGFSHQPAGLLHVAALRQHVKPTLQYAHDPMHVLAVHGVINITAYCCIECWTRPPMSMNAWKLLHGY